MEFELPAIDGTETTSAAESRQGQGILSRAKDQLTEGAKSMAEDARTKKPANQLTRYVRGLTPNSRLAWGRVLTEVVSVAAASTAAVSVNNTPGVEDVYKNVKRRISDYIVKPNFERLDAILENAPSIELPEARKERKAQPIDKQADMITNLLMDAYAVPFLGGFTGQLLSQQHVMRYFHVPEFSRRSNTISVFADRGVQLGSIIALNTIGADQSRNLQNKISSILQKAGLSESVAEKAAGWLVNAQMTNLLGMATSYAILRHAIKGVPPSGPKL